MALEQMRYIREERTGLSRASFRHMDRDLDTYYRLKVADTGAFLCFDRVAGVEYNPESMRISCILEPAKRGYQEQILVSGDAARGNYCRGYMYALGLPYIKEIWAERLVRKAKMTGLDGQALMQDIFVNSPRRCFTSKK